MPGGAIGLFLLAYGAATAVGSTIGGRAADWNAPGSLLVANAAVIVALVALHAVARLSSFYLLDSKP